MSRLTEPIIMHLCLFFQGGKGETGGVGRQREGQRKGGRGKKVLLLSMKKRKRGGKAGDN